MKKVFALMAVLGLMSVVAFADHHEGAAKHEDAATGAATTETHGETAHGTTTKMTTEKSVRRGKKATPTKDAHKTTTTEETTETKAHTE